MKTLEEKLENLKKQQEQAKEVFVKCQGAIELLQSMIDEKKDNKKQFFEIGVTWLKKAKV